MMEEARPWSTPSAREAHNYEIIANPNENIRALKKCHAKPSISNELIKSMRIDGPNSCSRQEH
jgi:hypothetical protein